MPDNGKKPLSLPIPETFHEVVGQVLRDGNAKDVARHMGRAEWTVSHWGNDPDTGAHPIPANKIVPFCLITKDMRPIEWLCQQVGGVFVRIPQAPRSMGAAYKEMAKVAKEFAEVTHQFSEGVRDGVLSDCEKKRLAKELRDLIIQAVRFQRILDEGGPR